MYAVDGATRQKVFVSDNYCETWTELFDIGSTVRVVQPVGDDVLLIFTSSTVYRSDDMDTFSSVLSAAAPFGPNGVVADGNTILFGEYVGKGAGDPFNLYRSGDGGENWEAVIEHPGESNEHHFHSCQKIGPRFIATTGDGNIIWYVSEDGDGTEWKKIFEDDSLTAQPYRTLGVFNTQRQRLLWASDGSMNYTGIYGIDTGFRFQTLTSEEEDMYDLNYASYTSIVGTSPILITSSRQYNRNNSAVLVSTNGGEKWGIDKLIPVDDSASAAGINHIYGPDSEGNYYITVRGFVGENTRGSYIMKINKNNTKFFADGRQRKIVEQGERSANSENWTFAEHYKDVIPFSKSGNFPAGGSDTILDITQPTTITNLTLSTRPECGLKIELYNKDGELNSIDTFDYENLFEDFIIDKHLIQNYLSGDLSGNKLLFQAFVREESNNDVLNLLKEIKCPFGFRLTAVNEDTSGRTYNIVGKYYINF